MADIDFSIGFDVDSSGLRDAYNSLNDLMNISGNEYRSLNPDLAASGQLTAGLAQVRDAAEVTQNALVNAFDVRLNTVNLDRFRTEIRESGYDLNSLRGIFSTAGATGEQAFNSLYRDITRITPAVKQNISFIDRLSLTLRNVFQYQVVTRAINSMISGVSSAYQYIEKLDTALNNIQIVTKNSSEQMANFAVNANAAAQSLGTTTTSYAQSALTFYQQGLSEKEVLARTNVTQKVANVTGQSASQVADELTAVWNGYKVGAEEAELYIDRLAAVATKSASSLSELSQGMSKVASTANALGVSEEQLASQLATIVSTTRQDSSSVGTALKTIYARMSDIKSGLDGETSLGNYTGKMNEMGVSVLDASGNLKDMGATIEEVGSKWSSYSREQQISLAQTMAGTRQYNNLIALFDNWDQYMNLKSVAQSGEGELQSQQNIYMDSLAASSKKLKASWENFYDSLLDDGAKDFFKNIMDIVSKIANGLASWADSLGGLKGILGTIMPMLTSLFSNKIGDTVGTWVNNRQIEAASRADANSKIAQLNRDANSEEGSILNIARNNNTVEERRSDSDYRAIARVSRDAYTSFMRGYINNNELESFNASLDELYERKSNEIIANDSYQNFLSTLGSLNNNDVNFRERYENAISDLDSNLPDAAVRVSSALNDLANDLAGASEDIENIIEERIASALSDSDIINGDNSYSSQEKIGLYGMFTNQFLNNIGLQNVPSVDIDRNGVFSQFLGNIDTSNAIFQSGGTFDLLSQSQQESVANSLNRIISQFNSNGVVAQDNNQDYDALLQSVRRALNRELNNIRNILENRRNELENASDEIAAEGDNIEAGVSPESRRTNAQNTRRQVREGTRVLQSRVDQENIKGTISNYVAVASVLSTVSNAILRLQNLGTIWNNENLTMNQKMAQTLSAISSIIISFLPQIDKLRTAFTALWASNPALLVSIGAITLLSTAFSFLSTRIQNAEKEQKNFNNTSIEKSSEISSELKNIKQLSENYNNLISTYDGAASSKENLISATKELAAALGTEINTLDLAAGAWDKINNKLNIASQNKIKKELNTLFAGIQGATSNLGINANSQSIIEKIFGISPFSTIASLESSGNFNEAYSQYPGAGPEAKRILENLVNAGYLNAKVADTSAEGYQSISYTVEYSGENDVQKIIDLYDIITQLDLTELYAENPDLAESLISWTSNLKDSIISLREQQNNLIEQIPQYSLLKEIYGKTNEELSNYNLEEYENIRSNVISNSQQLSQKYLGRNLTNDELDSYVNEVLSNYNENFADLEKRRSWKDEIKKTFSDQNQIDEKYLNELVKKNGKVETIFEAGLTFNTIENKESIEALYQYAEAKLSKIKVSTDYKSASKALEEWSSKKTLEGLDSEELANFEELVKDQGKTIEYQFQIEYGTEASIENFIQSVFSDSLKELQNYDSYIQKENEAAASRAQAELDAWKESSNPFLQSDEEEKTDIEKIIEVINKNNSLTTDIINKSNENLINSNSTLETSIGTLTGSIDNLTAVLSGESNDSDNYINKDNKIYGNILTDSQLSENVTNENSPYANIGYENNVFESLSKDEWDRIAAPFVRGSVENILDNIAMGMLTNTENTLEIVSGLLKDGFYKGDLANTIYELYGDQLLEYQNRIELQGIKNSISSISTEDLSLSTPKRLTDDQIDEYNVILEIVNNREAAIKKNESSISILEKQASDLEYKIEAVERNTELSQINSDGYIIDGNGKKVNVSDLRSIPFNTGFFSSTDFGEIIDRYNNGDFLSYEDFKNAYPTENWFNNEYLTNIIKSLFNNDNELVLDWKDQLEAVKYTIKSLQEENASFSSLNRDDNFLLSGYQFQSKYNIAKQILDNIYSAINNSNLDSTNKEALIGIVNKAIKEAGGIIADINFDTLLTSIYDFEIGAENFSSNLESTSEDIGSSLSEEDFSYSIDVLKTAAKNDSNASNNIEQSEFSGIIGNRNSTTVKKLKWSDISTLKEWQDLASAINDNSMMSYINMAAAAADVNGNSQEYVDKYVTEAMKEKYGDLISSEYSTTIGTYSSYGDENHPLYVAFAQVDQTKEVPDILSYDEAKDYVYDLYQKAYEIASKENRKVTEADLLKIDAEDRKLIIGASYDEKAAEAYSWVTHFTDSYLNYREREISQPTLIDDDKTQIATVTPEKENVNIDMATITLPKINANKILDAKGRSIYDSGYAASLDENGKLINSSENHSYSTEALKKYVFEAAQATANGNPEVSMLYQFFESTFKDTNGNLKTYEQYVADNQDSENILSEEDFSKVYSTVSQLLSDSEKMAELILQSNLESGQYKDTEIGSIDFKNIVAAVETAAKSSSEPLKYLKSMLSSGIISEDLYTAALPTIMNELMSSNFGKALNLIATNGKYSDKNTYQIESINNKVSSANQVLSDELNSIAEMDEGEEKDNATQAAYKKYRQSVSEALGSLYELGALIASGAEEVGKDISEYYKNVGKILDTLGIKEEEVTSENSEKIKKITNDLYGVAEETGKNFDVISAVFDERYNAIKDSGSNSDKTDDAIIGTARYTSYDNKEAKKMLKNQEEIAELAKYQTEQYIKQIDASDKLIDNYSNYSKALKSINDGDNWISHADSLEEIASIYKDLLGYKGELSASDAFVQDTSNLELLKKAAEGSSKAFWNLNKSLTKAKSKKLKVDIEVNGNLDKIYDWLEENEGKELVFTANLETGKFDTGCAALDTTLNKLWKKAGGDVDKFKEILADVFPSLSDWDFGDRVATATDAAQGLSDAFGSTNTNVANAARLMSKGFITADQAMSQMIQGLANAGTSIDDINNAMGDSGYYVEKMELTNEEVEEMRAGGTQVFRASGAINMPTLGDDAQAGDDKTLRASGQYTITGDGSTTSEVGSKTTYYVLRKKGSGPSTVKNNRLGGPGKKPKGGGGGSNGGNNSEKQDKQKRKSMIKDADPFHNITKRVKKLSNEMSKLNTERKGLVGKDLIKNLQDELDLIQKQNKAYEAQYKMANAIANTYKKTLTDKFGAVKDKNGEIDYTKTYKKWMDEYNKAAAKYEKSTKGNKDAEKEWKKAQDLWSEREEYLKAYEDALDKAEESITAIRENLSKEVDDQLQIFELEVSIRLNMEEAQSDFAKFKALLQNGFKADNPYTDALESLEKINAIINTGGKGLDSSAISTELNHLKDVAKEVENIRDNGENYEGWYSATYKYKDKDGKEQTERIINEEEALKDLQEGYKKLSEYVEELYTQIDNIKKAYVESIDDVKDSYEKLLDTFDMLNKEYEHQKSMIESIYGEESYDSIINYYDKMLSNKIGSSKTIDQYASEVEYWKKLLSNIESEEGGKGSERWQNTYENLTTAIENFNSSLEDTLEIIANKFEASLNKAAKDFADALTKGYGFDIISEEWERSLDVADDYLDALDRAVAESKLEYEWREAIDGLDGTLVQQKLNSLMEEQLKFLREKDELSEVDIERAEKALEIAKAQIALEEAQNNKNSMRLTRDVNGNYTYKYVANEDDVEKARQDLLKAQQDLYDYDKEKTQSNIETVIKYLSEYAEKINEASSDLNLTDEQRNERYNEIQNNYIKLIDDALEQLKSGNLDTNGLVDAAIMLSNSTKGTNYIRSEMSDDDINTLMMSLVPQLWSGSSVDAINELINQGVSEYLSSYVANAESIRNERDNEISNVQTAANKVTESDVESIINSVAPTLNNTLAESKDTLNKVANALSTAEEAMKKIEDTLMTIEATIGSAYNLYMSRNDANAENAATGAETTAASINAVEKNTGALETNANKLDTASNKLSDAAAAVKYNSYQIAQIYGFSPENQKTADVMNAADTFMTFDSGGYTGEWENTSGKLAILHQKEIVLNSTDTENLLNGISLMNGIIDSLKSLNNSYYSSNIVEKIKSDTLEQKVHIDASFPSVKTASEIENALNNLINTASQYILR